MLLRRTADLYDFQSSRLLAGCLHQTLPADQNAPLLFQPLFRTTPAPPAPPPNAIGAPTDISAPPPTAAGGVAPSKIVSAPPTIRADVLIRRYAERNRLRSEYALCVAATDRVLKHRANDREMQTTRTHCERHQKLIEAVIESDLSIAKLAGITLISAFDDDANGRPLVLDTAAATKQPSISSRILPAGSSRQQSKSGPSSQWTILLWIVLSLLCAALSLGVGRLRRTSHRSRPEPPV